MKAYYLAGAASDYLHLSRQAFNTKVRDGDILPEAVAMRNGGGENALFTQSELDRYVETHPELYCLLKSESIKRRLKRDTRTTNDIDMVLRADPGWTERELSTDPHRSPLTTLYNAKLIAKALGVDVGKII